MRKRDFAILYGCAIPLSLLFIGWLGFKVDRDAVSLLRAWDNFGASVIDSTRTPVYPFFLHLLQLIFGKASVNAEGAVIHVLEHGTTIFTAAVVVQYMVFCVSIYYFYRCVILCLAQNSQNPQNNSCTAGVFTSRRVALVASLVYLAIAFAVQLNNWVMTEPFAVSFSVFMVYAAAKLWQTGKSRYALVVALWMLLLVFLRPAFIYLPIILGFMGLWLAVSHRKAGIVLVAASVVVAGSIFAYCKLFERQYGIFSPTIVSVVNRYMIVRHDQMFEPQLIQNDSLRTYVQTQAADPDDFDAITREAFHAIRQYPFADVKQAVDAAVNAAPARFVENTVLRAIHVAQMPLFQSKFAFVERAEHVLWLRIGWLYLLLLVSPIIIYYRTRKMQPIGTLLWLLTAACIAVAIIGALDNHPRLILPAYPLWLLLIARLGKILTQTPPQTKNS